jgi:hypothetical protein
MMFSFPLRHCRIQNVKIGRAKPRRFGAGAYCAFATIAPKRVIGIVLLFGFYFGLINFITLNY